jgi:GH15 family glucan-1,4-alpha-glucosidase
MSHSPIAEYALLSDCHSAALVHRSGSVDWLCFPRFDSPSVFARLLDDHAGHWSISVADTRAVRRRYLDSTLVLQTDFETATGRLTLTDALAVGPNERGHELGTQSPHALLRRARCTAGTVGLTLELSPRPGYGVVLPRLRLVSGGILSTGGGSALLLSSGLKFTTGDGVAKAGLTLRAGQSSAFALQYLADGPGVRWTPEEIEHRLEETVTAWRSWSGMHQRYDGPWRELVYLSGKVLQGLTYQPTGAIVAAATTSLPETVGGERNWDYRYTWVRDTSLTLEALWVAACPDEAKQFFNFLAGAALPQLRQEGRLQIMFRVDGERDLTERTLPHLGGWRGSRPVRVGNGAWHQMQLDVYGELLSAVHRLREQLGELGPSLSGFLADAADAAAALWREPDQGIWEMRTEPRHFLHSKLMCWVALDRAIELADALGADPDRVGRWREECGRIRDAILAQGWSERAGAFTQAFGSDALDASTLLLSIVGFLPADDPRIQATVHAIADRLTDPRGLVYRYKADDGLEGEEGPFLLCTFWLAHALALGGDAARARETFERAAAFVNDLGLLSEEVDGATGELLGNFPQAFSHVGLVNAAWAIAQAKTEAGGAAPATEPLR